MSVTASFLLDDRFWSCFENILFFNNRFYSPILLFSFQHNPQRFIKFLHLPR